VLQDLHRHLIEGRSDVPRVGSVVEMESDGLAKECERVIHVLHSPPSRTRVEGRPGRPELAARHARMLPGSVIVADYFEQLDCEPTPPGRLG